MELKIKVLNKLGLSSEIDVTVEEILKNKDYLERTAIKTYDSNKNQKEYTWPWKDKESKIVLNSFGLDPISSQTINLLNAQIKKYPSLSLTEIIVNQQVIEDDFREQKRFLTELRYRDSIDLENKNQEIKILKEKLDKLCDCNGRNPNR